MTAVKIRSQSACELVRTSETIHTEYSSSLCVYMCPSLPRFSLLASCPLPTGYQWVQTDCHLYTISFRETRQHENVGLLVKFNLGDIPTGLISFLVPNLRFCLIFRLERGQLTTPRGILRQQCSKFFHWISHAATKFIILTLIMLLRRVFEWITDIFQRSKEVLCPLKCPLVLLKREKTFAT